LGEQLQFEANYSLWPIFLMIGTQLLLDQSFFYQNGWKNYD